MVLHDLAIEFKHNSLVEVLWKFEGPGRVINYVRELDLVMVSDISLIGSVERYGLVANSTKVGVGGSLESLDIFVTVSLRSQPGSLGVELILEVIEVRKEISVTW
jgi:hypothetical protein